MSSPRLIAFLLCMAAMTLWSAWECWKMGRRDPGFRWFSLVHLVLAAIIFYMVWTRWP